MPSFRKPGHNTGTIRFHSGLPARARACQRSSRRRSSRAAGAQPQARRAVADRSVLRPGSGSESCRNSGRAKIPSGRPARPREGARSRAGQRSQELRDRRSSRLTGHSFAIRCTRFRRRSAIGLGLSTLFAAWNAVIYVNQIEDDERLDPVVDLGAVSGRHPGRASQARWFVVQRRGVRRHAPGESN